jgi:hypothetical protein
MNVEEMKYGLIVIDKREFDGTEDGDVTILHFCGYDKQPDCAEINALREELSTDPTFGLMDIMEYCGIYDAPDWLVDEYRNGIISGEIEKEENE